MKASPRPEAVLFDLDDTLVVYDGIRRQAWSEILGEMQADGAVADPGELFRRIDAAASLYWSDPERHRLGRQDLKRARREILVGVFRESGRPDRELAVRIADAYSERHEQLIRLFPDALPALDGLLRLGVRMGLLTNGASDKQWAKIDRFGLRSYFEFCLVEGDLGFGKPDRRVYLKALELLGLPPGNVWMVGDNPEWDIAPAREMGLFTVWMDRSNHPAEQVDRAGPDLRASSLSELADHIVRARS